MEGYHRHPALWGDSVAFVSDDDLWVVAAAGGVPRRLTRLHAAPRAPRFSPDGGTLVFAAREEGPEDVYGVCAAGGTVRRLTYLGSATAPAGWLPDGRLAVASDARSAFPRQCRLLALDLGGGEPETLPYGRASQIAFGPGGRVAIGRPNFREYAYWKRYKGGTAGQIWLGDTAGPFTRMAGLDGDQEAPMWIGGRLYFLSAHEGVGNLYSVRADGSDVRRHTDHVAYFARNASSDGTRIVYHAGGDVYLFDPASGAGNKVDIDWPGPSTGRTRRYVDPGQNLRTYALHPKGHSLVATARGKPFVFGDWEGPVVQIGAPQGVHYRLAAFFEDGLRIAVVSDADGEDGIEIHDADGSGPVRRLGGGEIGRVYELAVSPRGDTAAVTNQRMELLLVDLENGSVRLADRSRHGRITDLAWSRDGRFVAYSWADSQRTRAIRLLDTDTNTASTVTRPVLSDFAPCFDPQGRYLYFLSARVYNPMYDDLQFAMSFPRGTRPYLVTLRRDVGHPFLARPRPLVDEPAAGAVATTKDGAEGDPAVTIDVDGIADRVLAFPVPEGRYAGLWATADKVLFLDRPAQGELGHDEPDEGQGGDLVAYDLKEQTSETIAHAVRDLCLSADGKTMAYRVADRLRVARSGEKAESDKGQDCVEPGRKSGVVDLGRIRVSVEPEAEWRQMLREAWRNMRDHFWAEDMSGVDWQAMYDRYAALVGRVGTRSELADLMWEMQGELGTSHAYVMPTEPEDRPQYPGGLLACEFVYDARASGYRLVRIVAGDSWNESQDSPLRAPGVAVSTGDLLVRVNGRRLDAALTPEAALVHMAGQEVALAFAAPEGERTVTVRALRREAPARYREWVDTNRAYVHAASGGRVGYVHVPDMVALGFSEFHRGYLAECERGALIVDVRFNAGGHVSQLLIERLRREVIGYDHPRWGDPEPYPSDAVRGPMVCLTNECAGSDGDIFTNAFRTYRLGPILGTRTWGGVIGISGERVLVDGTVTTQPEFSFWFRGEGWGVENHGVDPDIVVEDPPLDFGRGKDAQLERAVTEILRLVEEKGIDLPDFGPRPRLGAPKSLPPR